MTRAGKAFYTRCGMQRPPGRIGPILPRSPNAWINQVAERHRAFAALALTVDERRGLDSWLISRFVFATLQLERVGVTRKAHVTDADAEPGIPAGQMPSPYLIAHLTNAMRELIILTDGKGETARLTPELLIKLGGASFRDRDDSPDRAATSAPAAYLAQMVEAACDWFAADSFAELNPIEQAAIVFLRLATIQPFAQANEATALAAASLFTLRAKLPPMIINPQKQAAFRTSLVEADRMNMQPLVELIAEAVTLTLDEMTAWVKRARGEQQ